MIVGWAWLLIGPERDFRLKWAEKIGMGFGLPALSTGKLGKLLGFRKTG
jgi:hypothetical protein